MNNMPEQRVLASVGRPDREGGRASDKDSLGCGVFRAAVVALIALAGGASVSPSVWAQESTERQIVSASGADIRAFIEDVARATGRTFVIDPRVTGQVTVIGASSLSSRQYFDLFLATLRANGYVAIPAANGVLRIAPEEEAASAGAGIGSERFTTRTVTLSRASAKDVADAIRPLLGKRGHVLVAAESNTVVIADFAENVVRLAGIVAELDKDTDTVAVVGLRNARADDLAKSLSGLLGAMGSAGPEGGPRSAGTSRVMISAVASSNSILLKGAVVAVEQMRSLAMQLDAQAQPTGDTRVIFLKHADAGQLVELLAAMIGQVDIVATESDGRGSPVASRESAGSRGTIARYAGANALVVRAEPNVLREIESIVAQLDRRSAQVLVQAVVVEVSDQAAKDLGVQFLLSGSNRDNVPFAATTYGNSNPSLLALSSGLIAANGLPEDSELADALRQQAINALSAARGGLLGLSVESGDLLFGMIINAVKRDQGSNLLSTPSIMTLDNKEASILVGQDVPVTTGEVLGAANVNPFRTISREKVGIELKVRPQINADGAITLYIRQEVSSVSGVVSPSSPELIFNRREIETTVLADDGGIVVLGGLLDQGERVSAEKVPFLGDLPGVGGLFRSNAQQKSQTNLMVFIRPTILRDASDAEALARARFADIREQEAALSPERPSELDTLVRRYFPGSALDMTSATPARAN